MAMDSVFEEQRAMHEERERLIDTMTREWVAEKPTHKSRINSDHRIRHYLERYIDRTRKLHDRYTVDSESRENEARAIGGPNEFAEFYSRLKSLKEYHKNTGDQTAVPLSQEFHELNAAIDDPERVEGDLIAFTDEEGYGKYLDLNLQYQKYINLKGVKRLDYLQWLGEFDQLDVIPRETKKTGAYREYVQSLLTYIYEFLAKTRPLLNVTKEQSTCLEQFERAWSEGRFQGWTKEQEKAAHGALKQSSGHLDLSPYNSPAELAALGLDRLKGALQALGLNTLQERAARLFATKGKRLEELDPSLFASGKKGAVPNPNNTEQKERQRQHDIAATEAQIYHFVELLSEERAATRENVERKQARTAGEIEEAEEEEALAEAAAKAAAEELEVEADIPYNPKNLPLGWDGKPIPYWLYKLHGLNQTFSCEICGNQSYRGPKAFQMHFQEWRHSHGMRCLGIPNTAHFANITKIAEAVELWKKISVSKDAERFKPELEEEFEDSAGNVVTRKTFEDLKRQGLL